MSNTFDDGNPIKMQPVTGVLSIPGTMIEDAEDAEDAGIVPPEAVPGENKRKGGRPPGSKNKRPYPTKKAKAVRASKRAATPARKVTDTKPTLGYYKIHPDAVAPIWGSNGSACFDICAYFDREAVLEGYAPNNQTILRPVRKNMQGASVIINPMERLKIPSGLILDIPKGWSVRAHVRSSTGYKNGLQLPNGEGVIDWDYVNEFFILLINLTNIRQLVTSGDRVMQCEMMPAYTQDKVNMKELALAPAQKTGRDGGLGSTGKR